MSKITNAKSAKPAKPIKVAAKPTETKNGKNSKDKGGSAAAKNKVASKPAAKTAPAKPVAKSAPAKPTVKSAPAKPVTAKFTPAKAVTASAKPVTTKIVAAKATAAPVKPVTAKITPIKVVAAPAKPAPAQSAALVPKTTPAKPATVTAKTASTVVKAIAAKAAPVVAKVAPPAPVVTYKCPFPPDELMKWRQILLARRHEITNDIAGLVKDAIDAEDGHTTPNHLAERGSDADLQDLSLGVAGDEKDIVWQIDRALRKIDANRPLPFGLCEYNKTPIPRTRLQLIPFAPLSIEGATHMEQNSLMMEDLLIED